MAIQKQKKKTWDWFSKYIRLKYADENGMCKCYTCGREYHWKKIQCGHGLGGRTNNIIFNEDICKPQCYGCNVLQYGKLDEFGAKLRAEIGDFTYDHYLRTKHDVKKFTDYELKTLEEKYKILAKDLAEQKKQEIK